MVPLGTVHYLSWAWNKVKLLKLEENRNQKKTKNRLSAKCWGKDVLKAWYYDICIYIRIYIMCNFRMVWIARSQYHNLAWKGWWWHMGTWEWKELWTCYFLATGKHSPIASFMIHQEVRMDLCCKVSPLPMAMPNRENLAVPSPQGRRILNHQFHCGSCWIEEEINH